MSRVYLNDNWTFYRQEEPEAKQTVRLPHTNVVTPFNCFDDALYQFVSVYERELDIKKSYARKLLFLTFEGAAHEAKVYVGDNLVATHKNGYTAFSAEISKYVTPGKKCKVKVILDSRENLNIPPFGYVIDYMTYGGLYREVYLDVKDSTYIEYVFVKTIDCESAKKVLQFDLKLKGENLKDSTVEVQVFDGRKPVATTGEEHALRDLSLRLESDALELWDVASPKVYKAVVTLKSDKYKDSFETSFGVRSAEFKADGFYLNGKKLKIRGLNRHQSYPYIGYAMPQSVQEHEVDILRHELGLNAVRTSHYTQSKYFLDACDREGLLVFTECPGWQHIGNQEWKEQHLENVKEMVLQYRNHPSIVLWGVRINESQDDEWLYTRANDVARSLDDTRQTSGVRYLQKSQFLEDVYAFNDFSHNGTNGGLLKKIMVTPKTSNPYLVSEYNGHMYPTKAFDDEAHRLSHALRHATVLSSMYEEDNGVSGCFGWCFADYNTHRDFGSGDRICYHGVLDMFRNEKLAAAVYSSQSDEHPVMEISSSMDIGEHPAGALGDVYVFTNADSINLYKNDEFIKNFTPDFERFPNLPHPPIKVDDLIGCTMMNKEGISEKSAESIKQAIRAFSEDGYKSVARPKTIAGLGAAIVRDKISPKRGLEIAYRYAAGWGDGVTIYRFDAVKDGEVVKSITKAPMTKPVLEIKADHTDLKEKTTYDVATINIRAVSEYGNLLNYYDEPVSFTTEGPIELIGPSCVPLRGGMAGTYVKTTGEKGEAKLTLESARTGKQIIEFTVK
ncbi:MAG: glycoside hydrolase family 2 protein [Clostridia bacterium]|nr:glycoside hydrolase family 2 protein [Clostridia bacterium]